MKEIDTNLTCSKSGCSYDAQGNYSCQLPLVQEAATKETFSSVHPSEEARTCGGPFQGIKLKFTPLKISTMT